MIHPRNYLVLLFILSTSHFIFGQSENSTHIQEDCSEKEEIIKKQRTEIEKLHQKIELLESKLGIKPKNKEPKSQIVKAPKPEIPKPIITSVTIGSQTWTNTNLNLYTFRNGDSILHAKTIDEWIELGKQKVPAWCWYENDPKTESKIGKLYNWYAVNDSRGLAPIGWHILTDTEWTTLENHLGDDPGKKMKSTSGWNGYGCKRCDGGSSQFKANCTSCKGTQANSTDPFSGNGTNSSGFSGLPGGNRYDGGNSAT
jgi:uncharacterized protein (TIGR02145 family)